MKDAQAAEVAILTELPFEPTRQQYMLIEKLARFITQPDDGGGPRIFVLNGYAGTGKTSVVGAVVRALKRYHSDPVLLAPTGRAAKVFSATAGLPAYTIHRRIYRAQIGCEGASLTYNTRPDTFFIVDEASMIGDNDDPRWGGSLIDDLLLHIYGGADNCRAILVGDVAQLPPVGLTVSPAFDRDILHRLGMRVTMVSMGEVVRQGAKSGILYNATLLRRAINAETVPDTISFRLQGFHDILAVEGSELSDTIASAYANDGIDSTLLVTRTNWSADAANRTIRANVLYSEEELTRGERLMVTSNNYLWSNTVPGLTFIANGDTLIVESVQQLHERLGMRFADVTLTYGGGTYCFPARILLSKIDPEMSGYTTDRWIDFCKQHLSDPEYFPPGLSQGESIVRRRTDPFLNALQVKYAYAVTCHKAQGGQWRNVFVDMSAVSAPAGEGEDPADARRATYRWLYTAFTRATRRLYLVNLPEE